MIIGYTIYFKEILTNIIIKQTHSFESAINIIKKEWEINKSYMELNDLNQLVQWHLLLQ